MRIVVKHSSLTDIELVIEHLGLDEAHITQQYLGAELPPKTLDDLILDENNHLKGQVETLKNDVFLLLSSKEDLKNQIEMLKQENLELRITAKL